MSFEQDIERINEHMRPALRELHRNVSKPLLTDYCPEHWNNIIMFGQCWRHNSDGSLKSTFTKQS